MPMFSWYWIVASIYNWDWLGKNLIEPPEVKFDRDWPGKNILKPQDLKKTHENFGFDPNLEVIFKFKNLGFDEFAYHEHNLSTIKHPILKCSYLITECLFTVPKSILNVLAFLRKGKFGIWSPNSADAKDGIIKFKKAKKLYDETTAPAMYALNANKKLLKSCGKLCDYALEGYKVQNIQTITKPILLQPKGDSTVVTIRTFELDLEVICDVANQIGATIKQQSPQTS